MLKNRDVVSKELSITFLLRRLRTIEGLIKSNFNIDRRGWEVAMEKYSLFTLNAADEKEPYSTDSDMNIEDTRVKQRRSVNLLG